MTLTFDLNNIIFLNTVCSSLYQHIRGRPRPTIGNIIIQCCVTLYRLPLNFKELEMRGKAQRMARSASPCCPLTSSNKTKPFYHLANVDKQTQVLIDAYCTLSVIGVGLHGIM